SNAKWTLKESATRVAATGQVQLVVALENDTFRVELNYGVYARSSIIRQWICYRNISNHAVTVSDPYFFAERFSDRSEAKPMLDYMTGGGYFTGSQILKSTPFSPAYSRTFDSTDKPERMELDGVSYGYPLPWGSGAYMQRFCINNASADGLFLGFDYYGRWAADIGNFYGGPAFLGLRVAGFKRTLASGEALLTPKAFTGVYAGDLDAMGNDLKDWQYRYLWNYKNDDYFARIRYATEMRWQYEKGSVAVGGGTQDNWDYRTASLLHSIDVMRSVGADVLW